MADFLRFSDDFKSKYRAAERFVEWLRCRIICEARGDNIDDSPVDPTGRFWLGRLGPKDFVTKQDERGDRLEPCAIGLRIKVPAKPSAFHVRVRAFAWLRARAENTGQTWRWNKSAPVECAIAVSLPNKLGAYSFGGEEIAKAFEQVGAGGLTGEVRVEVTKLDKSSQVVEVTFVNTSGEPKEIADGRLFQCSLEISGLATEPFELEALPDSFRFNRKIAAFGLNCGVELDGSTITTSDSPDRIRRRPTYWAAATPCPDLTFESLASAPLKASEELLTSFEQWGRVSLVI